MKLLITGKLLIAINMALPAILVSSGIASAESIPRHTEPYSPAARFRDVVPPSGKVTSVFTVSGSPDGFVWMGTDDGLLRYDGYDFRCYRRNGEDSLSLVNNLVNSIVFTASGASPYWKPPHGKYGSPAGDGASDDTMAPGPDAWLMIVGTDSGMCEYDPAADRFHTFPDSFGRHVKSILIDGDRLYTATTTGLFVYDRTGGDGQNFRSVKAVRLMDGHFTTVRKIGGSIWAGSYGCIYEFPSDEADNAGGTDNVDEVTGGRSGEKLQTWKRHNLARMLPGRNILVLDICEDICEPGTLWAGTEAGLFHYRPDTGASDRLLMKNTPIKTFHYRGHDLWMGTDNGVALLRDGRELCIFRHDVRDPASIPNDVVWDVSEDLNGNLWFGTDHGAAICDMSQPYRFTGVDRITGRTDGLDIGVMEPGSDGCLWMGGRNGLICSKPDLSGGFSLKADSPSSRGRLSHNKVRGLHDDGRHLWIATDGGLDCYDYAAGKVLNCHISEPGGKYSSNWMYSIAEDEEGRLWLGTYDGGLFGVDKDRILASSAAGEGSSVLCDIHLSRESSPGLLSDVVRNVLCFNGNLYIVYGTAIDVIDPASLERIRCISMPEDCFILTVEAGDDCVWAGTDRGLFRLGTDGALDRIPGLEAYIISLDIRDGRVWVAGRSALASYNPTDGVWTHYPTEGLTLMSVCHIGEKMFFGTVDGVLEFSSEAQRGTASRQRPVRITELRTNDETVRPGVRYDGRIILDRDIRFADRIELPHSRNSFTLSLSAFSFGSADDVILFRLKGFDDNWRRLEDNANKAAFINVPSGDYRFEYALADDADRETPASIRLRIAPPWYGSAGAYIVYVILALGLVAAAYYGWSIRHRLKMEHIERERAIATADSKTRFLADIAHDFKSPLSIILGFVSKMSSDESDALKTRELQTVQKNAEKMNLLLHSMVEFNADGSSGLFVPSPVVIEDFVRDVWMRFSQTFADKGINCRFVGDEFGYMFLVDKVQMESALQNLLSNALKFTPSGGSILMSVTSGGETSDMVYADIKVEDTGCGIPEEELPKIFNRYYSGLYSRQMNPGGTGIGLDLVKQAVDLHRGQITVSSEVGKGSSFTIRLSTMKSDSFAIRKSSDEDMSLYSLSRVWQHNRKPIILLVEDNADIRDFIIASLGKDYVFLTADEGTAGLDRLKTEKIDLVVTDIAMPGMDGLTMSRRIRNSLDTAFLPIVVLTGRDDAKTRIMACEYADAFVAKPFDLNYLNGVIIKLLIKHEQYLDQLRRQKMTTPQTEEVESPDDSFLREMMKIITDRIDDSTFSAAVLHEESHWSEKQIYRKIKQLTGKTVSEFIRDVRMDKAAAYLSQGKLTVKEVMYKVGFTTPSYFTKCFRERFGVLPSDYPGQNAGN